MFDLTSGKLLLLGIVALIVLGPKDFPILLRTIGKYMGIIKKQADEFRAQFDEAIRESEFDQIKKDVEGLGQDLNQTMQETQQTISSDLDGLTKDMDGIKADIDAQLSDPLGPNPHTVDYTPEALREPPTGEGAGGPGGTSAIADLDAHDANGMPIENPAGTAPVAPSEAPSKEPVPVTVQSDRGGLNGSGTHVEHASAADATPKSGA
jgi:sec-independent protein translocase protein TatB